MAGGLPVSSAMSSCAMVPMKASGNQFFHAGAVKLSPSWRNEWTRAWCGICRCRRWQGVHALDAPLNADVRGPSRARKVQVSSMAMACCCWHIRDVTGDAVAVQEGGARIRTGGAVDSLGIAEPVAEGIQRMNGHNARVTQPWRSCHGIV